MSDPRTVAQQALEAYDAHEPLAVVMEDLRAALAEPVQEPTCNGMPAIEGPLSRSQRMREAGFTRRPKGWVKDGDGPEQEPVAWIHADPDKPRIKFLEWREDEPGYRGRWIKTPLYTAPPQRHEWTDADADAARLAMELEALLLSCKDTAAVSRWWDSAHDALELHRQRLSMDGLANQQKTSGSPCPTCEALARAVMMDQTGKA